VQRYFNPSLLAVACIDFRGKTSPVRPLDAAGVGSVVISSVVDSLAANRPPDRHSFRQHGHTDVGYHARPEDSHIYLF